MATPVPRPAPAAHQPAAARVASGDEEDSAPGWMVPTGGTSQLVARHTHEAKFSLGPVPVTAQVRFSLAIARTGALDTRERAREGTHDTGTDWRVRAQAVTHEAIFEAKASGPTRALAAKMATSLARLDVAMIKPGQLNIAGIPFGVRVETKMFDAAMSLDKLELSAMKLAVVADGDLGMHPSLAMLGKLVNARCQIRFEVALEPAMIHRVYQLAVAQQQLQSTAELEQQAAAAQRKLAQLRAGSRELSGDALRAAAREIDELEKSVARLRPLRAAAAKVRATAVDIIVAVGKALDGSAIGRVLSKAASKALALALKRILPIYNVISTVQDVYAVGAFLLNADWSRFADETTGSSLSASGGEDESYDGPDAGKGATPGEDLSPAALRVLEKLAAPGMRNLDASETSIINRVVPTDLTASELAAIQGRLSTAQGGQEVSLAESVIGAIQHVRDPARQAAAAVGAAATERKPGGAAPRPRTSKPSVIDLRGYLRDTVTVDPGTRETKVAAEFSLGGATFRFREAKSSFSISTDRYTAMITLHVIKAPPGTRLVDGTPIRLEETFTLLVELEPQIVVRTHDR